MILNGIPPTPKPISQLLKNDIVERIKFHSVFKKINKNPKFQDSFERAAVSVHLHQDARTMSMQKFVSCQDNRGQTEGFI